MRRILLVLLAILLVGCDGVGSLSDTESVARAQKYLHKGELKLAAIDLKNALSQNPKNPLARWLLGRLHMDIGNLSGAEKDLMRSRELGVSDESVLPLLAKVYLQQQKYEAVQQLVSKPSFSRQSRASLLTSQGLAALGRGDIDQAGILIRQALATDSGSMYALYGEAVLSIRSEDFEKARKLLDHLLELDAGYAQAWSLLGDLDRHKNKPEAAEEAYSKAIDSRHNNASDLLKRTLVRIQLKRYDEAQQDLDKLNKQAPTHPGVNYAQGLTYFHQQRYPKAQESFELSLRANEDYQPAIFYLGASHFVQGRREQAENYLSRFVKQNPQSIPGRKLLAMLKLHQRDYSQVETLTRTLVDAESDDLLTLNLMANALIGRDMTEEGTQLLERVVALQPESAAAKVRLGVGLLLEEEQSSAVANLESAIAMDPKLQQADMLLVLNYLRRKQFEQAQAAAAAFQGRQPQSAVAHNLLGLAYLGQQQIEKAKNAFEQALEVAPGDPAASHNLAALALMDKKPEEARTSYQNVLKHHDNDLSTLIRLAALEERLGDPGARKAALEQAMTAHPDAVPPRVLLARIYLQAGNREKALEVLGDLQHAEASNPALLSVMGEIQLADKDFAEARSTMRRLVDRVPGSAQAHFLLAKAYGGLGSQASMERELARSLELAPDHFAARLAETRLYIRKGDIEAATKSFRKLKEKAPNNPDVLAIETVLNDKMGGAEETLALLEQRFQKSPTFRSLLDLTRIRWAQGKQEQATEGIERWIADHPDDVDANVVLANAYFSQGRNEEGIAQYEKILQFAENNFQALNNLAWRLRKSNPERALMYAERANAVSPDFPEVMDTLSSILLDKGDIERARQFNQRALDKKPGSLTFLFRKARIMEVAGDQTEAVRILKRLLEQDGNFPERAEANLMWKRLRDS